MLINFTFTACDENKDLPNENKVTQNKNNISIKYVTAKNIPNIISVLKPNNGSKSKTNSSLSNIISAPFGSIYVENIFEVIDSLGNKNYSFTLIPKNPKLNSIFNLVVNTSNGSNNMAIMEYRMAPDFAEAYHNGTKTMSEFTGNILNFPFNNSNSNLFYKTSGYTCVQNIDEVVNCEEIIVEGGVVVGTGGGSSTTISDTYTYTGANGGTVVQSYGGGSAYWVCDAYGVEHTGPTNCGDGSGTWVITLAYTSTHKLKNPNSKTSTTSCCDQTIIVGAIGVNLFDLATDIKNILGMTTRTTESLWLIRNATLEHLSSIKYFLTINNESTDAKTFAQEMITQIANNPAVYPTITPFLIEKLIDDTNLDPCPKGVMEQLKKTTNVDIANVLAKLGANTIYTVNMVMAPANTYAETQKISKYNYEIRVDRDRYTDGTKLFKATALIHEIIHAYFLSIVDDYNNTPTYTLPLSFPELFEAYVKKTYTNPSNAQHKEMADKYVDAIASALQEYDANYTVTYQVYQDLAWGSLSQAPIFNTTYPLGSAENIRITNRYAAESSGHPVAQDTPNVQTQVGKPCN